MAFLWWKPVIAAVISIALGGGVGRFALKKNQSKIDRFFMGIFRDLGRHKALKRRHANSKGLILTILKQDDPLLDLKELEQEMEDTNLVTYTMSELLEFGNGRDGKPILISLFGRVYDVSKGEKFYGPKGHYHVFAGHDVTYALSTGCFRDEECVDPELVSVEDLSEKELDEGKRWLSFFHLHDKYPLVGKLDEGDYVETLLRDLLDRDSMKGDPQKPPIVPR